MRKGWIFNRYPKLELFDQGDDVKKASILLGKHGSKLQTTEYFSLAMRSAVMAFQKKHGLEKTGVIDKKTWKQLRKKHKVN